jgi:ssDNA-binding Zn-finger/Zn-ribbon topoisomerase 1
LGKCPDCGSPLYRNLALTGWWQCSCYPAPDRRKPEYRGQPECTFQCFTE